MLSRRDPERGFLFGIGIETDILVEFQFNPMQISDQRKVNYGTLSAPGMLMPMYQYTHGGDRTLSFTVRIDGTYEDPTDHTGTGGHGVGIERDDDGGITPELNKYRAFIYPKNDGWEDAHESFVPLYENEQEFTSPPAAPPAGLAALPAGGGGGFAPPAIPAGGAAGVGGGGMDQSVHVDGGIHITIDADRLEADAAEFLSDEIIQRIRDRLGELRNESEFRAGTRAAA